MRKIAVAELRDWERHGASWRVVAEQADQVTIDLCSCTGEAMDRVSSDDPELLDLIRRARAERVAT